MNSEKAYLQLLRAIRADVSRMADRLDTVTAEMRATRQHIAGLAALQDRDHVEISQIKMRLDRIGRHLDLVD